MAVAGTDPPRAPDGRSDELLAGRERLTILIDDLALGPAGTEVERELQDVLLGLLATISSVAEDDAFWRRLQSTADSLRAEDLERLAVFTDERLAPLLVTLGYRFPPAPPVDRLIDDTAEAIVHARDVVTRGEGEAAVAAARRRLRGFVRTVQVRISELPPVPSIRSRVLRNVGRRTLRLTTQIIPPVVGAGAAAMIMATTGAASMGLLETGAFASASEASKRLVELAAAKLMGDAARERDAARDVTADRHTARDGYGGPEDVRAALAALTGAVDGLAAAARGERGEPAAPRLPTGSPPPVDRDRVRTAVRGCHRALLLLEFRVGHRAASQARDLRRALDDLDAEPTEHALLHVRHLQSRLQRAVALGRFI